MRSSKSRSRSKANRPRTLGNIVNRVFDSSGPEGKVRGTPQQIIEKYQMLARDAQLSNDRVAAENFSQHAEHYTRMLAEAMREMAAEQESRQQYQQNNQNGGQNGNRDRQGEYRNDRNEARGEPRDAAAGEQPYVGGFVGGEDEESGLVELPETARQQPRREDQPRRDDQPRREDRNRDDRPRENRNDGQQRRFDNRREDRAGGQPRRDDRPREPRPQVVQEIAITAAAAEPVVVAEPARFESPAALVAQVEKAAAAAPAKPRAPKAAAKPAGEAGAEKPARAPRPKKPAVVEAGSDESSTAE